MRNIKLTVLSSVGSTDGWDWSSSGNNELVSLANMIRTFGLRQHKVVEVKPEIQKKNVFIYFKYLK